MRTPRRPVTAPLLLAGSLAGLVALAACGGDGTESVGFDELEGTKEGFAAVTDAAYVEAGEDPTDTSTRNKGVLVEDCLILDDEGFSTIMEMAGATEDVDERRAGALFGLADSQQTDCSFRGEDWETPLTVVVGTTTLTKDQLADRLGDNDVFEVVDEEIDGLDPDTVLVLESETGRSYVLVDDDFIVRLNVPTDAVDDEATAIDMFEVTVAEVERTLQS